MTDWLIDEFVLEEVALGCALLGSGGGGDIAFELPYARVAIKRYGPVRMVTAETVDPNALIAPIGFMGAPLEPSTEIAGQKELEQLIASVEAYFGQKVDALIPLEIGGGNGLGPLAHAGRLKIPVLDADTIGRAFPQLYMTSCALANVSPNPAFLADAKGNTTLISAIHPVETEEQARKITVASGSVTALSTYFVRGYQVKSALVLNSYTLARKLGQQLLQKKLPTKALAIGKIIAVEKRLEGGFLKGQIEIENGYRIWFQNEFLFLAKDGAMLATTPDVIALIECDTLLPLAIEGVETGKEVSIHILPGPSVWKTTEGLRVVGPEKFTHLVI